MDGERVMSLLKTSLAKAALLALCIALPATAPDSASAQTKKDTTWGEAVDLKPLMPLPVRPFLPPNSVLTRGSTITGSYSGSPLNDPTRDQATPGLRLTIPSR
jgi:hypothetical protein